MGMKKRRPVVNAVAPKAPDMQAFLERLKSRDSTWLTGPEARDLFVLLVEANLEQGGKIRELEDRLCKCECECFYGKK